LIGGAAFAAAGLAGAVIVTGKRNDTKSAMIKRGAIFVAFALVIAAAIAAYSLSQVNFSY
jgi:hypothetical protein